MTQRTKTKINKEDIYEQSPHFIHILTRGYRQKDTFKNFCKAYSHVNLSCGPPRRAYLLQPLALKLCLNLHSFSGEWLTFFLRVDGLNEGLNFFLCPFEYIRAFDFTDRSILINVITHTMSFFVVVVVVVVE